MKESQPSTPTATAQIKPPAPADSDSDNEEIAEAIFDMNSQDTEFGYRDNVAVFSTDRVVNEETIPKYEELKETEFVADKQCIICQKGNMDL